MSEQEHRHHHHDEHCDCGCDHDHEHEHHHHDEHCGCGHDHEHEHHHDEHCDCGCEHDHDHEHEHHHEEAAPVPGEIRTNVRLHDDAKVISGSLTVIGSYEKVRAGLSKGLEDFAARITEMGGVVGHIKASCEVKSVEMFSVTDVDVMVKTAPEQEINIILAAIVFFVSPEEAEELAKKALKSALC